MQSPKTKLTLYVTISACIVFLIWLGTFKYSIRRELKNKETANLFGDIKTSLNEAWAQKPDLNLSAPTTTQLQGSPELSKQQLEELITNLDIKVPTTTQKTTEEDNIKIK